MLTSTNPLASEGVAVDSGGQTYISSYSTNEIDIFAANAMGTTAPMATIQGSNTMFAEPGNMAIDSNGMLYVVNYDVAAIYAFANAANNAKTNGANLAPTAIISGSNTKLSQPFALTFDSQGHLLVADRGGSILSFDTSSLSSANGATENLTPVNVITGSSTDLVEPSGITVDSSGDIWVSDNGNAQILEFAPGASGNIGPIDRIVGNSMVNNTMLSNPFDIVFIPSNVVDQVSKGRRAIRGIGRAQR